MRVVMFLTGNAPFGRAWADVSGRIADVVTVQIASPRHTTEVAPTSSVPADYRVARPRLRPKRFAGPAIDRALVRRLVATLERIEDERGRVDVIHTHFYPTARLLPAVSRRLRIPYVHTEHSSSLTTRPDPGKTRSRAGTRAAARSFAAASAVMAVSQYLRRCIIDLGLASDVAVLGNPVAVDLFRPAPWVPPRQSVRLVTVGRLEADKRPEWLLQAFAHARARDPRLTLDVVGAGPAEQQCRELAKRLHVDDSVTFVGALAHDQVAARVAAADLFVCASRMETFGLAVAEAMAAGVPVVAPRVGALPELVGPEAGLLVDEHPQAIATGILQAAHRLDRFDRVAIAEGIRHRFSPEQVAARLSEIYVAATETSRRPALTSGRALSPSDDGHP